MEMQEIMTLSVMSDDNVNDNDDNAMTNLATVLCLPLPPTVLKYSTGQDSRETLDMLA